LKLIQVAGPLKKTLLNAKNIRNHCTRTFSLHSQFGHESRRRDSSL